MLTVKLKLGFGYLFAGKAAQTIEEKLEKKGVIADCFTENGLAKIAVKGIRTAELASYIIPVIRQRLQENGVEAQCQLEDDGIFIKVAGMKKTALENKVKENIQQQTKDIFYIDSIY